VYRRAGGTLDRDDGAVLAFTEEGVSFESELLGVRLVRWTELAALFVEVFGEVSPDREGAAGVPVMVDLANGGRVRGRMLGLTESGCELSLGGGAEVLLPLARILEIVVDDGSLVFLSDLTPEREIGRGRAFPGDLGMDWSHRIDRAVADRPLPLTAGGKRWARGIGTHAPTRVVWKLDPRWRRLRGRVAIDDSVLFHGRSALGSVIFRVRVGEEVLWESGVVRGGDDPVEIPSVDLGEAGEVRELTLEADAVEELHGIPDSRGDRADWLRVILVRG